MSVWFEENWGGSSRVSMRVDRHLYHAESPHQVIDVFQTADHGTVLALDGIPQASTEDEFYYHEMLVHPAMVAAKHAERVLVLGGGDGGSAREALRYDSVERVTMVELDEMVTRACQKHLGLDVPWDDPRLDLRFADAVGFVEGYSAAPYDVVIVDSTDPSHASAALFGEKFYRECRRIMSPGGVMAAQSASPHAMPRDFLRIVRGLRSVFETAEPLFAPMPLYTAGYWSYTMATDGALVALPERVEFIEPRCRYYNGDVHQAAFVKSNAIHLLFNGH